MDNERCKPCIPVGWWAPDAADAAWGFVFEVPRPGDFIVDKGNRERQVQQVIFCNDGTVRLRVA